MNKDRIKGTGRKAKGALKEAAGKATGDRRLEAEGKGDKVAGSLQKTVGRAKDRLKGK
jgi:uncharacterized protein YjbJ (UPF0337 family)